MKNNCIKISNNNGADDLAIHLHNGITKLEIKSKIPKIIHIMWIGADEPPTECINSWWEMHPDWEHIYWDDEKVANFAFKKINMPLISADTCLVKSTSCDTKF